MAQSATRMLAAISVVASGLVGCSIGEEESLEQHTQMYRGWCAYQMELGYQSTSISDCAQEIWDYGQRGEMKPLHESFKTLREMNDYIAFEGALRTYCDLMKDSPTQYEQLLGLTRIGELTFEECKDQLIQLEWITEALSYVRYDPERSSRWTYEPGVTYRINGKIYNDPFGLDYKNGPSDVFGDGR